MWDAPLQSSGLRIAPAAIRQLLAQRLLIGGDSGW